MSIDALLELIKLHGTPPPTQPARPPVIPASHTTRTFPWRNWFDILVGCGCSLTTASKWEAAFQNQMEPDTLDDESLAHFLGQCLHETSMFQRLQEDLYYAAARLMQVWPSRFPNVESTAGLVRSPRALAERVYGGRLGNDLPGDGFAYRGRGFPMITGKNNYEMLQTETGESLVDSPDLLLTPFVALKCGLVWWKRNIDGTMDVETVTKIVNGGQIGLDERRRLTAAAQRALLANPWK